MKKWLKKQYSKKEQENKVKVHVPKQVYEKIQYLCNKISQVEWSGILLYTIKNSIKDISNFSITLEDIILIDKGTKASTGFSYNEKRRDTGQHEDRMIDYFNNYPIALEENWKTGLIHSHNTMQTFFSNVDMEELEENSKSHNFYLSFIVNNFMDFTAKIGITSFSENNITNEYYASDEEGEKYLVEIKEEKRKKEKFIVYNCDIILPELKNNLDENFLKNVEEVLNKKDFKNHVKSYNYKNKINNYLDNYYDLENDNYLDNYYDQYDFNDYNNINFFKNSKNEVENTKTNQKPNIKTDIEDLIEMIFEEYLEINDRNILIENPIPSVKLLKKLVLSNNINIRKFSRFFIDNFPFFFEDYFEENIKNSNSFSSFWEAKEKEMLSNAILYIEKNIGLRILLHID